MKKSSMICFITFILVMMLSVAVSAAPACTAEDYCDSMLKISEQKSKIPFTGDASWMSVSNALFDIQVEYSDGLEVAVDPDPHLIFMCSLDGVTFDSCEADPFVQVGVYTLRVTAAQNDKLFYLESYADTTLKITDANDVDLDGLTVTYHDSQSDSGKPVEDSAAYAFGDNVTILGNLGLDENGNPSPLTKDGYTFKSWNDAEDLSGHSYPFGETIRITRDLDLYPEWVAEGQEVNAAESQEPALDVNSPEPTEDQAKQASINDKFQLGEGWFAVGDEAAQDVYRYPETEPEEPQTVQPSGSDKFAIGKGWYPVGDVTFEYPEDFQLPQATVTAPEQAAQIETAVPNETVDMAAQLNEESEIGAQLSESDTELEAKSPELNLLSAEPQENTTDQCLTGECPAQNTEMTLPHTGFSTRRLTAIREQPAELTYSPLNIQLQVPLLDVNAEVVKVPDEASGWAVEWLGDRAGLLEGSALPGEGISYIAAHNHLNAEEAGPFLFIRDLKENDRIFIRNANGDLMEFSVFANELYGPDDFTLVQQKAQEYEKTLVLITCENESAEGGYLNRRVVFAKPI